MFFMEVAKSSTFRIGLNFLFLQIYWRVTEQKVFLFPSAVLQKCSCILLWFVYIYSLFLNATNCSMTFWRFLSTMRLYTNFELQMRTMRGYILERRKNNGLRFWFVVVYCSLFVVSKNEAHHTNSICFLVFHCHVVISKTRSTCQRNYNKSLLRSTVCP